MDANSRSSSSSCDGYPEDYDGSEESWTTDIRDGGKGALQRRTEIIKYFTTDYMGDNWRPDRCQYFRWVNESNYYRPCFMFSCMSEFPLCWKHVNKRRSKIVQDMIEGGATSEEIREECTTRRKEWISRHYDNV